MAKKDTETADGPFVLMVHKDFEDRQPARVTRRTFEQIWKEKGWKEFKGSAKEAASIPSNRPEDGAPPEGG